MSNVQFNYLYRDAGNYKNHGSVILANPDNYSLAEFEQIIKAKLIDGLWFNAEEWGVPDLHFEHCTDDDHNWHEFVSVEFTNKPPTLNLIERIPAPGA